MAYDKIKGVRAMAKKKADGKGGPGSGLEAWKAGVDSAASMGKLMGGLALPKLSSALSLGPKVNAMRAEGRKVNPAKLPAPGTPGGMDPATVGSMKMMADRIKGRK